MGFVGLLVVIYLLKNINQKEKLVIRAKSNIFSRRDNPKQKQK